MLGLARRTKARFLLASTSEVYGDPEVHPQPESYRGSVNTIGVRSCYDEGKRIAETLCMDYKRMHGTEIRISRIFNTYGPRMLPDDGRVVSNFIVQALSNKPITIYGDGSQTRSFCFVSDLINGMVSFMEEDGFLGPLNLGNPNEVSMLNLADIIIDLTNSTAEIQFLDLPKDDPIRRKPDISLARNTINWEPKVSLIEGLKQTIDYFKRELGNV